VQETGRAGRDGKPAFCHLFLDDTDYLKLRSLAHRWGTVSGLSCRWSCTSVEVKSSYIFGDTIRHLNVTVVCQTC
jgi:superfamily II DNA helicase RecQ